MQLLDASPAQVTDGVLFTIFVPWERVPAEEDIARILGEIERTCQDQNHEVIFVGPKPAGYTDYAGRIAEWIDAAGDGSALNEAVQKAKGACFAFVDPRFEFPPGWLKYMYHYFLWHPDAGGVRAFSTEDNYREVTDRFSADNKPANLREASGHILKFLIGNEMRAPRLDGPCVLVGRRAWEQMSGCRDGLSYRKALNDLGNRMTGRGFTRWQALEVFAYLSRSEGRTCPQLRRKAPCG